MNMEIEYFVKSCLELGEELLDKSNLTNREIEFLKQLDIFIETIKDKLQG